MNASELKLAVTPERIREWAYEGCPQLAAIEKDETFAGASLLAGGHVIHRARDYETALPIIESCERAVKALARRLETALCGGESLTREGLHGPVTRTGVTPLYVWECRPTRLYSLGPVPQMLDLDGIVIIDGEVRFGYYANTGPADRA
jgi:hypothetical protein